MGWKKVALAGCLPALGGGCHLVKLAAHNAVNEPLVVLTEGAIERGTRSDAKAAWQQVREQFPRRMFTADFRDGFVDGYSDYLAHGGTAQPPAVPPLKYTRNKKYYTPEGHCLIRDYYLGFKYGGDVAVATGRRKFLTVPVLLADKPDGPPTFNIQPAGAEQPLPDPPPASKPEPLGAPKPLPAPPGGTGDPPAKQPDAPPAKPPEAPKKVETPKIEILPGGTAKPWDSPATVPTEMPAPKKGETPPKKADPPKDFGSKFGPPPTVSGGAPKVDPAVRLPIPDPPLPTIPAVPRPTPPAATPGVDPNPVRPTPPPLPKVNNTADPKGGGVKPASFTVALPEPPAEVPTLPDHLPTPSVLDELPVPPANHAVPAARPANHAVPPALPQP